MDESFLRLAMRGSPGFSEDAFDFFESFTFDLSFLKFGTLPSILEFW